MHSFKSLIGAPMFDIMRVSNKEIVSDALVLDFLLPGKIIDIQTQVWANLLVLLQDVTYQKSPDKIWSFRGKTIGNVLSGETVYDMLYEAEPSKDHISTIKSQVDRGLDVRLRQGNPPAVDDRIKERVPKGLDQVFQSLFDQFECRYNTETEQFQWYDATTGKWGGKC